MNKRAYLRFKVLYRDDVLEIEVIAANGKYCGATSVYMQANGKRLMQLGEMLASFPESVGHKITYEFGADKKYLENVREHQKLHPQILADLSYVGLTFQCKGDTNHTFVEITLHDDVDEDMVEGIKAKVYLRMPFDPAYLTDFGKGLIAMGNNKRKEAILRGYLE